MTQQTQREIPTEQEKMRHIVYTIDAETLLVKFLAHKPPQGLEKKGWNPAIVAAKQRTLADAQGVDANAYRADKIDTGLQIMFKEPDVLISDLLTELEATGYKYTNGHFQFRDNKGPVTTLTFSKKADAVAVPMPETVRAMFRLRWNHCTIWANIQYDESGKRTGRLDTINLAKWSNESSGRRLHLVGRTYRLA